MAKRKWHICPGCEGEGKCVNPAIDCNGLSSSDFADDPDFRADYISGMFDQKCAACKGSGKVTDEQLKALDYAAEQRRTAALENGSFEDYAGAQDRRWGY